MSQRLVELPKDSERQVPMRPEAGRIYFAGEAAHGDVINVPEAYGTIDDYFLMVTLINGGIAFDSIYHDNGFSGYAVSYEALPDRNGWKITATSADNAAAGMSGGMSTVAPRNYGLVVHYAGIRVR